MIQEINHIHDQMVLNELHSFPNQAFIWEIIEGKPSGKIYQFTNGAVLILENCSEPFVFIAGNVTEEGLVEAFSLLKKREFPRVYYNPIYHPLFLAHGWNVHLRIELYLEKLVKRHITDKKLNVRKIDNHELFKKCFWYNALLELYVEADNALKYCTGFALCLDGQVLSEAYVSISGGYAEVAIVTGPEYRGKGYALQILTYLLEKYGESGLTIVWSCDVDNKESLNTGLRLGFKPENYYVQMVPKSGNTHYQNRVN